MRSILLPLVVISGMACSGAAFAATTASAPVKPTVAAAPVAPLEASGTITKIDTVHDYVVLSDGFRYHLPKGFSLKGFKVGEKVLVTYDLKGKHHDVTAMKAA